VSTAEPKQPSILPFAVMCAGMFMALLDIQIVASSLQNIGGGLSAAQDEISWVQTSYLIAEIIMIPLSGWLSRVFSTRCSLSRPPGSPRPACCAASPGTSRA
jgi:MFS transporter, DHA2 family, multidrug resistance protein